MSRRPFNEQPTIPVKPCPFCGGTVGFVERMTICSYRYRCDCGADGPQVEHGRYEDHEGTPGNDAARAWNRRAKLPKRREVKP